MIKLNKDSWYMRRTMAFHDFHPDNLCQLIRFMIGSLGIYILSGVLLSALAFFVFYPIAYLTPFAADGFFLGVGLCIDGLIIALTFRQIIEAKNWEDRWFNINVIPDVHAVDVPLIKLLWKFLVAIHDKTCPLITYK